MCLFCEQTMVMEEHMEQPTFADVEYESKKRRTRREVFWNGWMV